MTGKPSQSQAYPGETDEMRPRPKDEMGDYEGRGLLSGKRALVTGGDWGFGRAVVIGFAKEGADVAISYLEEDDDARYTYELVEREGRRCLTIGGDMYEEDHTRRTVHRVVRSGPGGGFRRAVTVFFASNRISSFYTGQNLVPAGGEIHPG
jgi:hypothetical protein